MSHKKIMFACGEHVESQCRCIGHNKETEVGRRACPYCTTGEAFPEAAGAVDPGKASDALAWFAAEIQKIEHKLLAAAISDVPGRTADVKEIALFRLKQTADMLAEEAVALERFGE